MYALSTSFSSWPARSQQRQTCWKKTIGLNYFKTVVVSRNIILIYVGQYYLVIKASYVVKSIITEPNYKCPSTPEVPGAFFHNSGMLLCHSPDHNYLLVGTVVFNLPPLVSRWLYSQTSLNKHDSVCVVYYSLEWCTLDQLWSERA